MSRKKEKIVKDTTERWLLTYADLMNLLLILFIILYAMSQVDQVKYEQLSNSFKEAFGISSSAEKILPEANSVIPIQTPVQNEDTGGTGKTEEEQMEEVKQKVDDIAKKEGLAGSILVSIEERCVVISIKEKVLFKSGSADIDPVSRQTIEAIGRVLQAIPGKQIRVEGHTDADPIRTSKFPDNQELSTARANSVWRILVRDAGLEPTVVSATGYGEYRPLVPNDTDAQKAQNRRVDIAILRSGFDKSEAGAGENSGN
jgi:chemotaxis protein MotB